MCTARRKRLSVVPRIHDVSMVGYCRPSKGNSGKGQTKENHRYVESPWTCQGTVTVVFVKVQCRFCQSAVSFLCFVFCQSIVLSLSKYNVVFINIQCRFFGFVFCQSTVSSLSRCSEVLVTYVVVFVKL